MLLFVETVSFSAQNQLRSSNAKNGELRVEIEAMRAKVTALEQAKASLLQTVPGSASVRYTGPLFHGLYYIDIFLKVAFSLETTSTTLWCWQSVDPVRSAKQNSIKGGCENRGRRNRCNAARQTVPDSDGSNSQRPMDDHFQR